MTHALTVLGRSLKAFYDDQMTHHAAALTYYALMSLFPAVLLALSLLGLIGQYPETYNAIVDYLRDVAPASVVDPVDRSLRERAPEQGDGGDDPGDRRRGGLLRHDRRAGGVPAAR